MARQGLVWGPSSRFFGRMDPRLLWKALMRIQLGGRTWAIYRDQSLLKKPCSASWIWLSHCGQANQWGFPTGHPHRAIVEDAKLLLTYTGVSPSHNYCFAWQFGKSMCRQLGKNGVEQAQDLVIMANVPPAISSLIIEDFLGVGRSLVLGVPSIGLMSLGLCC